MDGGFGAPLGGEAADSLVYAFVEAEQVTDDAAVEEGAVGVGILRVIPDDAMLLQTTVPL